jgi:hypothetical protein
MMLGKRGGGVPLWMPGGRVCLERNQEINVGEIETESCIHARRAEV